MQKALLLFLFCFFTLSLFSLQFTCADLPNDDGSTIKISWQNNTAGVGIYRLADNAEAILIVETAGTSGELEDNEGISAGTKYTYQLRAAAGNVVAQQSVTAEAAWFNTKKLTLLIFTIIFCFAIIYYILSAKSGKEFFIRPISGLESMDEAVGRATEMGRPILFVPGINDLDDMQTIAGLTILGKLAKKAAEHDATILVPVCRSMVLTAAKEVVKAAFLEAGKADAFREDSVFYLTDDQFGFVAGVDGIIVREKPAANFFLGAFYAESLILAETGFASGAIQTAGTAMPSQLPFFVAACDYTLIGEELFAASAYLSREHNQLGCLKGQDFGKLCFVIILAAGIILEILDIHFIKDFLNSVGG